MDEEVVPHVLSVCSALGGFEEEAEHPQPSPPVADGEGGSPADGGPAAARKKRKVLRYVMGDECLECLRDLKRYLRFDSKSPRRLLFFALGKWGILRKDLVPILLLNTRLAKEAEAMGKRNERAERTAQAVVELLVPLTWPVDKSTDNPEGQLDILRDYKEVLQENGVLSSVVQTMLVALSLPSHARTARSDGIIRLGLSLVRNLLAIPDPEASAAVSGEQLRQSFLQEELVVRMERESVLDLVLTFASSSDEEQYAQYNVLVLEIFSWIFHGLDPEDLFKDPKQLSADALRRALRKVDGMERDQKPVPAPTRHSSFGGTVVLRTESGEKYNIHKNIAGQACLRVLDESKKQKNTRGPITDPYDVRRRTRNPDAARCLRQTANSFLQCCFNPFLVSVRRDIELERLRIQDEHKRHFLRLFGFFLCFQRFGMTGTFRRRQAAAPSTQELQEPEALWGYDLVGGMLDQRGIRILLKIVREAMETTPPDLELLHVGVDCLRNVLLTLAYMQESTQDEYRAVSENLQDNLYYEGSTLDMLVNLVKGYKREMSRGYLQTLVETVHVLLKSLEKFSKSKQHMYVRKKKAKRKKKTNTGDVEVNDRQGNTYVEAGEQGGAGDDEDSDDVAEGGVAEHDPGFTEATFDFGAYVRRYAHEAIVKSYLLLLEDQAILPASVVKCIAALFFRVVFDVGDGAVFFSLSTMELFRRVLDDLSATGTDKTRAHEDLEKVLLHIVRALFKKLKERPLLYVELLFPKTRPIMNRIDHDEDTREVTSAAERGRAALAAERAAARGGGDGGDIATAEDLRTAAESPPDENDEFRGEGREPESEDGDLQSEELSDFDQEGH